MEHRPAHETPQARVEGIVPGEPEGLARIARERLLPAEVATRLGPFYVYLLVDPRTGDPFYAGKGTGARLLSHGLLADLNRETGQSEKSDRISAIRASGAEPRLEIVRHGLDEQEAFLVEAALIDCLPGLTNRVAGHGALSGRTRLSELVVRYGAQPLSVVEPPAVLIRLTPRWLKLESPEELEPGYFRTAAGWHPAITPAELLDAARGWWKVSPKSIQRRQICHAVAVAEGVTRGLFEILSWVGPNSSGRWAFTGESVTAGPVWEDYVGLLGRRVPFARHSQNPIAFWPPAT